MQRSKKQTTIFGPSAPHKISSATAPKTCVRPQAGGPGKKMPRVNKKAYKYSKSAMRAAFSA